MQSLSQILKKSMIFFEELKNAKTNKEERS